MLPSAHVGGPCIGDSLFLRRGTLIPARFRALRQEPNFATEQQKAKEKKVCAVPLLLLLLLLQASEVSRASVSCRTAKEPVPCRLACLKFSSVPSPTPTSRVNPAGKAKVCLPALSSRATTAPAAKTEIDRPGSITSLRCQHQPYRALQQTLFPVLPPRHADIIFCAFRCPSGTCTPHPTPASLALGEHTRRVETSRPFLWHAGKEGKSQKAHTPLLRSSALPPISLTAALEGLEVELNFARASPTAEDRAILHQNNRLPPVLFRRAPRHLYPPARCHKPVIRASFGAIGVTFSASVVVS